MSRLTLFALTVPSLAGCTLSDTTFVETRYPEMELSQGSLDFGTAEDGGSVERTLLLSNQGGMPMGIGSIGISDADDTSFSVSWSITAVECPVAADTGASAKGFDTGDQDTGTGGGGSSGGDDTGTGGGGGGLVESEALFVLDPGCRIPLTVRYEPVREGDAWNALEVVSVGTELTQAQEDAGEDLPAYLADRVHTRQLVYLHGDTSLEVGRVLVTPRSYDFGFVHPDDPAGVDPGRISIGNVGDGPITVRSATLSKTCDPAFRLQNAFDDEMVLEGGTSTLSEIVYTPTTTDPAYCQLTVETDDATNPTLTVVISANSGDDPLNEAPTAFIRSPDPGYHYTAVDPLELEINIFDVNQPATTLDCSVRSAVLQNANVADCTAPDESGHMWVEIEPDSLDRGTDTLVVTVTDAMGVSATASVSVLVDTDPPQGDYDGDGYTTDGDEDGENYDCDDRNAYTFPYATEIYDGDDNDCDGAADENTEGRDDDLDGTSELDGDCNDLDEDIYVDAPERADGVDNDCDGTIDEGTVLYDDDGDGYADVDDDCDDEDASAYPGAPELCDGIDNDCDGPRDSADGCVNADSEPTVVGDAIWMRQSACLEGETINMSVTVYDPDQDTLSYEWSANTDSSPFDNPLAQTVVFTAPQIAQNVADSGMNVSIYVVVSDEDGQDWASGKIAVWDSKTELYDPYREVLHDTGAGVLFGGLGLLAALRRKR